MATENEVASRERIKDVGMKEIDLATSNVYCEGKATVEVRDKKGLLRSSIPRVSVPVAWTVLFFNVFVPGSGTVILAVCSLCGVETHMKKQNRCLAFWLNMLAAILQLITALIVVGWTWSVFWGMHAVTEANNESQNRKNRHPDHSIEEEQKKTLKNQRMDSLAVRDGGGTSPDLENQ